MQKHLSALEPRIERVAPATDLGSALSADAAAKLTVAVPVEQLHSRALVALIGVIEDQWRFCNGDEESKSDVPRATDCSHLTEEEEDYESDDQEEKDLLSFDLDDMTIHSLLEITSTTARKRRPPRASTLTPNSPRVAAIKSFSIFRGEFPILED